MLQFCKGNILDEEEAIITIPVNTIGTLGAGLAKEAKIRYPNLESIYLESIKEKRLDIGTPILCHCHDKWFFLFATKKNWRHPSRLKYIDDGFNYIKKNKFFKDFNKIAFPKLGCGLGGLDWKDVLTLIHVYFANSISFTIKVYGEELDFGNEYIFKNFKEQSFSPLQELKEVL